MDQFLGDWHTWIRPGGSLAGAALLALVGHHIIFSTTERAVKETKNILDDFIIKHVRRPTSLIFPLLAVLVLLPVFPLSPDQEQTVRLVLAVLLTPSIGWLIVRIMAVVDNVVSAKYDMEQADNLLARQIHTLIQLLRRIAFVVILIVTLAVMLMIFPNVRHIGITLFTSAGVAGLVVGIAARPVLSNIIAGIQVALTAPIRLDDVVIVEGEWGWIEEIGISYVVVRLWDKRNLVVPLSYFIERPFQNWTRRTADLLGTVFVYTDYSVPVEEVRQELHRILESSDMWDKKVWGLQVTNATEHTTELRALMSAPDSPKAWDLRCHVREKLIEFLQERHPHSWPKTRTEIWQSS